MYTLHLQMPGWWAGLGGAVFVWRWDRLSLGSDDGGLLAWGWGGRGEGCSPMRSPSSSDAPQMSALAIPWEFGDASECPWCLLVAAWTVPHAEYFVHVPVPIAAHFRLLPLPCDCCQNDGEVFCNISGSLSS